MNVIFHQIKKGHSHQIKINLFMYMYSIYNVQDLYS